jgi:hypothetical protein
MTSSSAWKKIFDDYKILNNDFKKSPFLISAQQIKESTKKFKSVNEREVRILCKQDTREDRPGVFKENNLFILPVKNGYYAIVKGEGYFDVPAISSGPILYEPKIDFELKSSKVGNSEMQHLDYAYATSIIRTFSEDPSLVLTIRGRKYTPKFDFKVCGINLAVESVQTEVDAGYEGKNKIVLVEAKNSDTTNVIIRQLYYPFRQWKINTGKDVELVFFEKKKDLYNLWRFEFKDENDYNSISLLDSKKFKTN